MQKITQALAAISIADVLAFAAVRAYYHFGDHFGYVQMADPMVEEFIADTVHLVCGFFR